jgi:multidrug efflux pump subunit AcrA (membrane-fusion protein)/AcrR family transcriptional regulator
MTITTRKERERREREARILQLAQGMLRESGYLGLSMDRIAAGMDYSKGTIYQHFPNKEEIVLALANEALETRVRLFEKGAGWSGTTRERISAIGVAAAHFVRLYPQHFAVEQLVRSGAIWEKTTEQRRNFMLHCETSCMRVVGGVVHEAVVAGDLRLREGITPADVVFGLWSMNFGAYIIITGTDTLGENRASRSGTHPVVQPEHAAGWLPVAGPLDRGRLRCQSTRDCRNTVCPGGGSLAGSSPVLFFCRKFDDASKMTQRKHWGVVGSLAALPILLGGAYWAATAETGTVTAEDPRPEILPVATLIVEPVEAYQRSRAYTGVLRERRRSALGFQRAGEIVEIYVEEGDAVTAGDVLARLDNRQLLAREAQIQAQVAESAALLEELVAGPRAETIAAKRAELEAQTARCEALGLQLERREKLVNASGVSREEYEATLYDYRAALAVSQQIQRQLDEFLAGTRSEQTDAQRARLAQLEASLAEVQHDLEDTVLKAPFSGRISRRLVDEGTVIASGDAVLELLDDTQLEAWIGLPPSTTERMYVGETHLLEIAGRSVLATLRALGPDVDEATRTRKVILRLPPEDSASFLPGQVVRLAVSEQVEQSGFWVPTSALARGRRGLWAVFVVDPQDSVAVVAQRDVELLDTVGSHSFVRGTLRPGDQVVAAGTHRVVVGQQVLPQPTSGP